MITQFPKNSEVGLAELDIKKMHDEMAKYAQELDEVEKEKYENEMSDFVHKGNIVLDFDPSDIEDDIEVEDAGDEEALEDATGEDDLDLLKKFYLTSAEMLDDSEVLKTKHKKRKSQADIWSLILKEYQLHCPSLAKVIELILVIPSSTAEVERFFKILKEMKTKKRNRLTAKKLRKLFLIYHFLDLDNYDRERVYALFLKHLQK